MTEQDSVESEKEDKEKPEAEKNQGVKEKVKEKTEMEPAEIIRAPVEAPEIEEAKPPASHQKRDIAIGFGCFGLAIILVPFFIYLVPLAVAIIGVVFIAMGVMVR